jgi:exodeoxyribonuclease VII large subunit
MHQVVTLYQLNEFVKRVIALNFQDIVWVTAEIAQIGTTRGHRYLDLVEHGTEGIVAQLQATIWQGEYRKLKIQHGDTLDQLLVAGTQVKLGVYLQFHERFGLKANIQEVDIEWTFGHLELIKRRTLETLSQLKLLDANKSHPLPMVLQRLAVISSEKAAGLQDFVQQLTQNTWGYAFRITLFDTLVQGAQAQKEIISALQEIAAEHQKYDAVIIIRGGGARLDLAVFDELDLNKQVALMPLPVLAGIGHDTDQTVLDLVVHTPLKTPTAVAEFVLQHNLVFESRLRQMSHTTLLLALNHCRQSAQALDSLSNRLLRQATSLQQGAIWKLEAAEKNLPKAAQQLYTHCNFQLKNMQDRLNGVHPDNTLRRGFSITRYRGKAITSVDEVPKGAEIETQMHQGTFKSLKK